MGLPEFKCHPGPIATGSVTESDAECACCSQARGLLYTGPVYSEDELHDAVCPWCIGDGSAHEKCDATFTDEDGIGDFGDWDAVPSSVVVQVAQRAPGCSGWQQERCFAARVDSVADPVERSHA